MPKFLHTAIILGPPIPAQLAEHEGYLSQMGAKGWELVSVMPYPNPQQTPGMSGMLLAHFKKQCPADAEEGFNAWARENAYHK